MVFVCIFQHLVISKHYAVEFNENLWLYLEKGCGTIRLFHMFDVTTMLNIHQLNAKQFSLTAEKKSSITEFHCGVMEFKNSMFPGNTIEQTKRIKNPLKIH